MIVPTFALVRSLPCIETCRSSSECCTNTTRFLVLVMSPAAAAIMLERILFTGDVANIEEIQVILKIFKE